MNAHRANEVLAVLSNEKVVPVVRVRTAELAQLAVKGLVDAGFRTAEITMTIPEGIELIKGLANDPGLLVGAGTVLDIDQARASIRAGARFVVSPCMVDGLVDLCNEAGVLCIMNGLTPHEVYSAWRLGSGAVKVFPAESVGGPRHIKALKSVFPGIPLVPTGGVNLSNVSEYLLAGATFVGAGSDLVREHLLTTGGVAAITEVGRKYREHVGITNQGG